MLMEPETLDVFDLHDFDIEGEMLVIYAGGKPRLAYRRHMGDRWSPQIRPDTPQNTQSP